MTIVQSQGQAVATLTGTTGAIAVQNSVSGNGYNAGSLKVYKTVSPPANANTAEVGADVLATVTLPNPCMGAPTGLPSTSTANSISNVTIAATGTASYFRLLANGDDGLLSTTERRIQGSVGVGTGDLQFNTLSLIINGTLSITALSIQAP